MRHESDGYEKTDAKAGATFRAGLYILATMFVTALLVVPFYRLLARSETAAQPPAAEVIESAVSEPVATFPKLVESEPRALARVSGAGGRAAHELRLGREGQGTRSHPDRRGDEDRGRARPAEVRGKGAGRRREVKFRTPVAFLLVLLPALAAAQMGAPPPPQPATPGVLQEVGFDQHLGESVPLDLAFTDETGRSVKLSDYFGKKPVVLSLVYYKCPMLCTISLNGLAGALEVLSFVPGQEFEVVTVSFDPKETPELAAAKKQAYMARYKRPEAHAGWHFLTGPQRIGRGAHAGGGLPLRLGRGHEAVRAPRGPAGADPRGRGSPTTCSASSTRPRTCAWRSSTRPKGKIGNVADQLLLYCYQYDPQTGRYSASILNLVRAGGSAHRARPRRLHPDGDPQAPHGAGHPAGSATPGER